MKGVLRIIEIRQVTEEYLGVLGEKIRKVWLADRLKVIGESVKMLNEEKDKIDTEMGTKIRRFIVRKRFFLFIKRQITEHLKIVEYFRRKLINKRINSLKQITLKGFLKFKEQISDELQKKTKVFEEKVQMLRVRSVFS